MSTRDGNWTTPTDAEVDAISGKGRIVSRVEHDRPANAPEGGG